MRSKPRQGGEAEEGKYTQEQKLEKDSRDMQRSA